MRQPADKPRSEIPREAAALARLAAPIALAQLGMMALGVVDMMMVGHLSKLALASVSLGHAYTFGLMILGMGALFVLDPLISQAHGARDTRGIAAAMQRGIVLALLLSVPFGVLFHATRPLLEFLADQPEAVPVAHAYAKIIAYGLPAFFIFVVFKQSLQAMSIVRPVMIAVVLGNAANVFLNLGFIYGRFGLPALGAVGSAWATTLCRYFMVVCIVLFGFGALRRVWVRPARVMSNIMVGLQAFLGIIGSLTLLIGGIGVANIMYAVVKEKTREIGVQMALEVWVFLGASFLCVRMGIVEMGGHTIALNLSSVSFMVPIGIGAAGATRTGNAIGRGDAAAARRSALTALFLGASVMLVSAVLFTFAPRFLARLYTSDAEVIAMAAALLPIAGLFQVFDGTQAVACGVLRGAGETRLPLMINLLGYWLLGLPAGIFLAFALDLGPRGLWWGLTVGLMACAALLVLAVRRRLGVRFPPAGQAANP